MNHCHDCERPRVPEGGVQMTVKRWICARCWGLFLQGRQFAKELEAERSGAHKGLVEAVRSRLASLNDQQKSGG